MTESTRDYLNSFISVEVAQMVSRVICAEDGFNDDDLNIIVSGEIKETVNRIGNKYRELKESEEEKHNMEKNRETAETLYLENVEGLVLDMYWGYASEHEIANSLNISVRSLNDFLNKILPVELIYEKYSDGMYPSKIARLAVVKNAGLNTNKVRRILQMDPV